MSQVCTHCGEVLEEEGRLVCPHCGADVDQEWSEAPAEAEFGSGFGELALDEDSYERFLEAEGLAAPKRKKGGCGGAVLAAAVAAILAVLLL